MLTQLSRTYPLVLGSATFVGVSWLDQPAVDPRRRENPSSICTSRWSSRHDGNIFNNASPKHVCAGSGLTGKVERRVWFVQLNVCSPRSRRIYYFIPHPPYLPLGDAVNSNSLRLLPTTVAERWRHKKTATIRGIAKGDRKKTKGELRHPA